MGRRFAPFLALLLFLGGCAASQPSAFEGRLLVAKPGMAPNLFSHTVVLLMRHDASGAFGFILNRPGGETRLSQLLDDLRRMPDKPLPDDPELPMHLGGPVGMGSLFLLHSADFPGNESILASGRYVLSQPLEILERMSKGAGRPKHVRLMLGYSGWGAGQLEDEIARDFWEVVDADEDLVFAKADPLAIWERAWRRRAIGL